MNHRMNFEVHVNNYKSGCWASMLFYRVMDPELMCIVHAEAC